MAEVLVLAEHAGGEVKKVTLELLTAARRLGSPSVVWTGPGAQARRRAAGGVRRGEGVRRRLAPTSPATSWRRRRSCWRSWSPRCRPAAVLVAGTTEGKEIAGRLAVKTGSGVLTDAVDVIAGEDGAPLAEQPNFGGAITVHSTVKSGHAGHRGAPERDRAEAAAGRRQRWIARRVHGVGRGQGGEGHRARGGGEGRRGRTCRGADRGLRRARHRVGRGLRRSSRRSPTPSARPSARPAR